MKQHEFDDMLEKFVSFAYGYLGIKNHPIITYEPTEHSFGSYSPSENKINITIKNRHPMDVLRTLAHELVHCKQHEDGRLDDVGKAGETGSDIENEANAQAGVLMRHFGKANRQYFLDSQISEAFIVVGGVGSGKDRIIKEINGTEIDIQKLPTITEFPQRIISGANANNLAEIRQAVSFLNEQGYRTAIFFVEVSNETSRERNEKRAKPMNEETRYEKYLKAHSNKKEILGLVERSCILENNAGGDRFWEGKYDFLASIMFEPPTGQPFSEEKSVQGKAGAGEWGTPELTNRYKKDTPGQHPKKKKKVWKEDGIGATTNANRYTSGASPFPSIGESAQKWMTNEDNIKRYQAKYGDLAEEKMLETAMKISDSKPTSFANLRKTLRNTNR